MTHIMKQNVCRECHDQVPEYHHIVVIKDNDANSEFPIQIGFADENNNVLGTVKLELMTAVAIAERLHVRIIEAAQTMRITNI